MNLDEKKVDQNREAEKTKILTICFERPSSISELSETTGNTEMDISPLVDELKEEKLLEEEDGKLKTTNEGDYRVSS